MEIYIFIIVLSVLAAICFAYSLGRYVGHKQGLAEKKLVLESLTFKQAMKWWAYHEILRHNDDIRNIRDDIRKLADVEMPKGTEYGVWVDVEGNPKIKGKRTGRNPLRNQTVGTFGETK